MIAMKIIRNKLIPFKGFAAMNILGLLFVREEARIDAECIRHEAIHTVQQYEIITLSALIGLVVSTYFASLWYLLIVVAMPIALYLLAWLIELILPPYNSAYKDSPFEREAYMNEQYPDYLEARPPFAWIKYILIKR